MAEKMCVECNERPAATAGGICMQCFLARTKAGASATKSEDADGGGMYVVDETVPHVSEATTASPTLGKLESTATGWLVSGVLVFLVGLIVLIVGSVNLDPGAIQWGVIIGVIGGFFIQFGFLFFILGRHARVQAEVALYVKNNS
jgi:hypothetical protein